MTQPRRTGARARIALGLVFTALVAGTAGWLIGAAHRNAPAPLPSFGVAPQYKLVNQLGETVNSAQFRGKVQIVTFLFPYCTTYCPLITSHLVGFERTLARAGLQNKVQIVAFNVDPSGTGQAQMRQFLAEYGWKPSDLHLQYLTGTPQAIRRVVTQGFHIAYQKVKDNASGPADHDSLDALTPQPTVVNTLARKANVGYDVTHNDGLEVVDRQGHIRKIYDDADTVSGEALLRVVKSLLPAGQA